MKEDVRSTWRLLAPHAKPHLWTFVLVFLLGSLTALGERSVFLLIEPTWSALWPGEQRVQDEVEGDAPAPDLAPAEAPGGFFAQLERVRGGAVKLMIGSAAREDAERLAVIGRVALAVAVIGILTALCQYAFTWLSRWVALRMVVDLRVRLARHLMGLSMRYHDSRRFGDVLSRISADVNNTLAMLNDAFRELVREPLLALVSILLAFLVAPVPTLVMVVTLPTIAIPVAVLSRKVRKGSTRSLSKLGASVQVLSQMFQGIRTVKAFRAEGREIERYRRMNEEYVGSTMRMVRAIAMTNSWTVAFTHAGLALILVGVSWLTISRGDFASGGSMATFFLLISNVYNNIKKTTRVWTRVQESVGASERLQALLDEPADIVEREGAVAIEGLGSGIRFEKVSFAYPGADRPALVEIELEIRPGETLALVGASGAGKSTLVDLVARFVEPTAGRITVDGRDLCDLTLDSWTALYAMVSQSPFLFHASVEENVGYGRPGATREEIEAAARAADIHDYVASLPEGYATDVADMGARLSGGQRQRITIARAILKGAPLLLLDEATSALDTETEVQVQAALDRLMQGRTVIVIAHRLSTVRNADRIAVLDRGRLVELGTHEELLARNGVYARLHAAQLGDARLPAPAGGATSLPLHRA